MSEARGSWLVRRCEKVDRRFRGIVREFVEEEELGRIGSSELERVERRTAVLFAIEDCTTCRSLTLRSLPRGLFRLSLPG